MKCKKRKKQKQNVVKTKTRRIMLLPKCAVYDSEILRLIKEQEVTGLLIETSKNSRME